MRLGVGALVTACMASKRSEPPFLNQSRMRSKSKQALHQDGVVVDAQLDDLDLHLLQLLQAAAVEIEVRPSATR